MATTTDLISPKGAFVHRLGKGHTRWFFQVSLPLSYLEVDLARLTREPDLVQKEIAHRLDFLFQQPGASERASPPEGSGSPMADHLEPCGV